MLTAGKAAAAAFSKGIWRTRRHLEDAKVQTPSRPNAFGGRKKLEDGSIAEWILHRAEHVSPVRDWTGRQHADLQGADVFHHRSKEACLVIDSNLIAGSMGKGAELWLGGYHAEPG